MRMYNIRVYLKFNSMKVFKKQSENLCLQPEDLRAIRGGSAENVTSNNLASEASFPYMVREKGRFNTHKTSFFRSRMLRVCRNVLMTSNEN